MSSAPLPDGCNTHFQAGLMFASWANQVGPSLTWRRIVDRWGVSRSTAFRWLRHWRDTQGQP